MQAGEVVKIKKQVKVKVYYENQNVFDFKTDNLNDARKKFKNIFDKIN